MPSLSFSLSGIPPSQNKRRHHMVRYRDDQMWKASATLSLRDAINRQHITGLPWQRVHVTYAFHYPRITLADPDNLIGSMKPILDSGKGIAFSDDNVTIIHLLSVRVDVVKKIPAGVSVIIEQCACVDQASPTLSCTRSTLTNT